MFGYQPGILATKVGVVAATIGNASPVIFTNYNRPGARKEECGKVSVVRRGKRLNNRSGYAHVRPERFEDEPCIWEA